MFNLDLAKEITLKKNNDDTYNLIAKMDVCDTNKKISEMECNCHRVKIKSFDVELLSTEGTLADFNFNIDE